MVGALQVTGAQRLIQQSLNNNPSLQTALANLRAARQAVYAQEGKFFPFVDANFNPTRQLTAGPITPVLNSAANPYNLYTAQVGVAYTFECGVSIAVRSSH